MPSNTARIAKNTLVLYFRQIVIMLVSLYTVRVVLETLGAEDYGIYSVVGGVVVLFTFLNNAMASTTQRFLNFALGQNNIEQARNVYSASLVIHALIAVMVVVFAQTVGLWFFYTWLNIPPERQPAAFAVYQFSVMAAAIAILQVPYRATIIAYEKMSFFAILSIFEAVSKLGIAFLLPIIIFDSLLIYAFFICITGIIIFILNKLYCNKTFEIAHFRHCRDKELFKQLLGFSGWSVFGGVAIASRKQGINMLINIFHGVTANASMGLAMQVNSVIYRFASNFQTAFSPQIVKSYSAKEHEYCLRLIFHVTKVSFCLLFFFVLPLYANMDFVLQIWLRNVPAYTVVFTQMILLSSLVVTVIEPLRVSVLAIGDIKKDKLVVSGLILANLPLSLLILWLDFNLVWIFIIRIGLETLTLAWRIIFLSGSIKFPVINFLSDVIVPIVIIAGLSAFITVFLQGLFIYEWNRLIISFLGSTVSIGCLMYWIGLNKQEKLILKNWIKMKIGKGNSSSSK